MELQKENELALLGGGCFWCLEAAYLLLPGVIDVKSGYAGGTTNTPSYSDVCTGITGHAEVVQICYDADQTSFSKILDLFWKTHDPTSINGQGADIGTQYRSVIFYMDDTQKIIAQKSISEEAKRWPRPIATQLQAAPKFFPAEDTHHRYFQKHPLAGYCQAVIAPKVAKVRMLLSKNSQI